MADAAPITTPVGPTPQAAIQAQLDRETAPAEAPAAPAAPKQNEETQPAQPPEPEAPAGPNTQEEGDDAAAPSKEVAELPLDQVEAIELEVTTKGEGGKDIVEKLPVKELKLGYMRNADYSRKTKELAEQRAQVAENTRQAIETERSSVQMTLQQLQALVLETVAPELNGVDMNKLATDDPFEYVKRRNRLDQIQQTLSKIDTANKEITGKQRQSQDANKQAAVARARETLQADIPGWNDTLYQQLMKSSESYGYTVAEVSQWVDPRAIKLLYAAEKGKTAAPVRPSNDKKLVAVPKTVKPGASSDQAQDQNRLAQARKHLRDTGSVDSAAAVIRNMLK